MWTRRRMWECCVYKPKSPQRRLAKHQTLRGKPETDHSLRRNQPCPTPWSQTSDYQNWENLHLCCLSCPVSGTCYSSSGKSIHPISNSPLVDISWRVILWKFPGKKTSKFWESWVLRWRPFHELKFHSIKFHFNFTPFVKTVKQNHHRSNCLLQTFIPHEIFLWSCKGRCRDGAGSRHGRRRIKMNTEAAASAAGTCCLSQPTHRVLPVCPQQPTDGSRVGWTPGHGLTMGMLPDCDVALTEAS